jgi:hypothetical protein
MFLAVALAAPTSQADEAKGADTPAPIGFASIAFTGGSPDATYHLDGHTLNIPVNQKGTKAGPVIIRSGKHVVEVRQGEDVIFHEEVVIKPEEEKTIQIPKAK